MVSSRISFTNLVCPSIHPSSFHHLTPCLIRANFYWLSTESYYSTHIHSDILPEKHLSDLWEVA